MPKDVVANGPKLNSIGAKAMSMGGAYVGLADDFSAIFWNPAGLTNLSGQSFSFFGAAAFPSGTYELDVYSPHQGSFNLVDAKTRSGQLNFSGLISYFRSINDRIVVGVGVYSPANNRTQWEGSDFINFSPHATASNKWMSRISLIRIAPGVSYKVNDKLSIGAAFEINHGVFDIAMHSGRYLAPIPEPPYFEDIDLGQYELNKSGWGLGLTVGVLFRACDFLSIGAVFRSPSSMKLKGKATVTGVPRLGDVLHLDLMQTDEARTEMTWPMWLATGISITPIKNLTLTADFQWIRWSTVQSINIDYSDNFWQYLMDRKYKSEITMNWENVLQIRTGAEWKIGDLSLRGGFYIDPSPVPESTLDIFFPGFNSKVITLGMGFKTKNLHVDFGVEYSFREKRSVEPQIQLVWPPHEFDSGWQFPLPGTYSMTTFTPSFSLRYAF
ncbi:OmpP1/FadL family transporter [Acidobacteriota bacterium]